MEKRFIIASFLLSLTSLLFVQNGWADPGCAGADQIDFIDSLKVTDATKILLYQYATTAEGQDIISKLMTEAAPGVVGPTASSITTPTGHGSDWGMVAIGGMYADGTLGISHQHALSNATVGFGDADKYFGLSVSALIDNIKLANNYGKNGTVAMHLFHNFPNNTVLAVGMANAVAWGEYDHSANSYYMVGTKTFVPVFRKYAMPVSISVGGGTGAFESAKSAQEKNDNKIGFFGSVGWQVLPRLSLIGETVTQQVNFGVSMVPFKYLPLMINLSECNLNRYSNKSSYFIGSLAVGYSFN